MLILKRKIGQSLLIGGQTIVKVLGTQRGVAIIGIEAPVGVPVLREEAKTRAPKKQEGTP
jgi:carbon storage regulator CsrA